MFYDNDSQLVFNFDYQLTKKELSVMITKILIIPRYTIKCNLSFCSLQHNIMHYFMALTHNSLPKVTLTEQTIIKVHSSYN